MLMCTSTISKFTKYRYLGSFTSSYVPTADNDTFAIMNELPSNMQGEQCIMIANSCHKLYFADSLDREAYSFLKQQYKQMMPESRQCHPSVCGIHTMFAAFHLQVPTGVHDVNVLSFISKLHVMFQSFQCKSAGCTMFFFHHFDSLINFFEV